MTPRIRQTLICVALVATTVLLVAAQASAATFGLYLDPSGIDSGDARGSVYVNGLNTGLNTRLVISPPSGPSRADTTQAAGTDYMSNSAVPGLNVGDTIKVYQPSAAVTPTASYVVPQVSLGLTVGAAQVVGSVPAGYAGAVQTGYRCGASGPMRSVGEGAFALGGVRVIAGSTAQMSLSDAGGNYLQFVQRAPGETPCVTVFSQELGEVYPGAPTGPPQYLYSINSVFPSVQTSLRAVIRRGATALSDHSWDPIGYDNADVTSQQVHPGDVIDVYRPKTAAAPTWSLAIPQVSARFDPAAGKVAVDAPAASEIEVYQCRALACLVGAQRTRIDVPAGRTVFDFTRAEGQSGPSRLYADDRITITFRDVDGALSYHFGALLGDLIAPTQKLTFASKIKRRTLVKSARKGLSVKLSSSEPGTASLKLTYGKLKLASVKKSIKSGKSTLKLKFTKSGKRKLGKLKGKRITLTSTVSDASGNITTIKRTARVV